LLPVSHSIKLPKVQTVLHRPKMLDHLAVPKVAKTARLGPMAAKTSGMWMLG
jgi:hypothetical protein